MYRVDFYIYSLHEVIVWAPIWRALRRLKVQAQWVVEPPGVHTARGSAPDKSRGYLDRKDENLVPLMTPAAHREITTFLMRNLMPYSLRADRAAHAVVTTQGTGWLGRYRGLRLRTQYGVGAVTDGYGHGAVNSGMDAVFAHGDFSRGEIARWVEPSHVHVTGFPKYAAYFRGELDRGQWRRRWVGDTGRPLVVYLSTWAHNSSIDRFADAIGRLAARYPVLYKPHHNNLHLESERIDPLRGIPGVVVEERTRSIVPFLSVADLVLADVRSGALTEAFLTDRRVVGLSPRGDPSQDRLLPEVGAAAPVCADPDALAEMVGDLLRHDPFQAGRRELARYLFADLGGRDDERTAEAMLAVLRAGSAGSDVPGRPGARNTHR